MEHQAQGPLDAIIIAGEMPAEYLGEDVRNQMRLAVDGISASLRFLREYFRAGRDTAAAVQQLTAGPVPFVSLNGPYLQQFLAGQGVRVEVVPLLSHYRERFAQLLAQGPRAVIISTTFLPFAEHIDKLAAVIKHYAPQTTVIAGGIQVWKSYQHRLLVEQGQIPAELRDAVAKHNYFIAEERPSPVDLFIISNRGEETLARVLQTLRDGGDPRGLANVAHYQGGRWVINPLVEEADHEIKVDWRAYQPLPAGVFVPVLAGQGCGFGCRFCDFWGLRGICRRDTDSIVAEVRTIPEIDGVRRIYFTDDNLFPSRARVREVCRALIASGMRLRWRGMAHVSVIDEETAALMADAGCLEILLGVESGDGDILRAMGKHTTPEDILRAITALAKQGINTKSTFIIGFPGETAQTVANTAALLNAFPTEYPAVHRFMAFSFGVLPLARISRPDARAEVGLTGYGFHWKHATMTSEEADHYSAVLHDAVKPELSPSYVLEVPELSGMAPAQMQRVFVLRNQIARLRRGLLTGPTEDALWRELEAQFADALRVGAEEQIAVC